VLKTEFVLLDKQDAAVASRAKLLVRTTYVAPSMTILCSIIHPHHLHLTGKAPMLNSGQQTLGAFVSVL
jgi:hypothetical protein